MNRINQKRSNRHRGRGRGEEEQQDQGHEARTAAQV